MPPPLEGKTREELAALWAIDRHWVPRKLVQDECLLCGRQAMLAAGSEPEGFVVYWDYICTDCVDPQAMFNRQRDWHAMQRDVEARRLAFDPILVETLDDVRTDCLTQSKKRHAEFLLKRVIETLNVKRPTKEEFSALFEVADQQHRIHKQIDKLYKMVSSDWENTPRRRIREVVPEQVKVKCQLLTSQAAELYRGHWEQTVNEDVREYTSRLAAWKKTLTRVTIKLAITKPVLAFAKGEREQACPILFPLWIETLGLPEDSPWLEKARFVAERWPALATITQNTTKAMNK